MIRRISNIEKRMSVTRDQAIGHEAAHAILSLCYGETVTINIDYRYGSHCECICSSEEGSAIDILHMLMAGPVYDTRILKIPAYFADMGTKVDMEGVALALNEITMLGDNTKEQLLIDVQAKVYKILKAHKKHIRRIIQDMQDKNTMVYTPEFLKSEVTI